MGGIKFHKLFMPCRATQTLASTLGGGGSFSRWVEGLTVQGTHWPARGGAGAWRSQQRVRPRWTRCALGSSMRWRLAWGGISNEVLCHHFSVPRWGPWRWLGRGPACAVALALQDPWAENRGAQLFPPVWYLVLMSQPFSLLRSSKWLKCKGWFLKI